MNNIIKVTQKWYKNQFFYSIAVTSIMFSNISISIIGARILTVSEYGLIALVKPTIVIFSSFFGFGLSQAFNHWRWREGTNKKELVNTIFGGIIVSSLLFSIFLFIIFAILLKERNELISFYGYISLLILCISYLQNNEMLNFYRVDNLKIKFTLSTIVRSFLQFIIVSVFFFYTRKYTSFVYGLTLSETILYFILVNDLGYFKPKFNFSLIRDLINFGFPNSITICGSFALTFTDRYMINYLTSDTAQIGIYDVNYLIAGGFITFISRPLNLYIQPYLTKIFYKENLKSAIKALNQFQYKSIIALSLATLLTLLLGNSIIKFIFSESFLTQNKIIIPLTISFFINSLRIPYITYLNIRSRNKIIAISIFTAILINILLNLYLIPISGIFGASIATFICSIIELFILIISSKGYTINQVFYTSLIGLISFFILFGLVINITI